MELKVEKREVLGKKVEFLRKQGLLPAELYGHGVANLHLSVNSKEFEKVYKEAGENTVINVSVDGVTKPVLIYDVQLHPVKGNVEAVDLYEVKMDEEIGASVPLEFTGESAPVKEGLGVFVEAMDEIEVEALPADIPQKITVDISFLKAVGDSIYVKDLPVTSKYKFTIGQETVVASVAELEKEEEKVETEMSPDQVVVETEEKKAGREAAKSTGENES
jgi:large subunit ribosomal protein L25